MTETELKERLEGILESHEAYSKDLLYELFDFIVSDFEVEEDEESEEEEEE